MYLYVSIMEFDVLIWEAFLWLNSNMHFTVKYIANITLCFLIDFYDETYAYNGKLENWESKRFSSFFIIIFIVCLCYLHKMQYFTLILPNMISSYMKIYIISVFMSYCTFIRNPKNAGIINFYFFFLDIQYSWVMLFFREYYNILNIILLYKQIQFCYFFFACGVAVMHRYFYIKSTNIYSKHMKYFVFSPSTILLLWLFNIMAKVTKYFERKRAKNVERNVY